MISVTELYRFVSLIANKEQRGTGPLKPDGFNILLPRAQNEYIRRQLGLSEAGDQTPIYWEASIPISDSLRGLFVETQLPVDVDGQVILPSDYFFRLAGFYRWNDGEKQGEAELTWVRQEEAGTAINDPIAVPTYKYVIAVSNSGGFKVYPSSIDHVLFRYIRRPATPVFVYTLDASDRVQPDSALSIDIELVEEAFDDIAAIILSYVGSNTRDQYLKQVSEARKQAGY